MKKIITTKIVLMYPHPKGDIYSYHVKFPTHNCNLPMTEERMSSAIEAWRSEGYEVEYRTLWKEPSLSEIQ